MSDPFHYYPNGPMQSFSQYGPRPGATAGPPVNPRFFHQNVMIPPQQQPYYPPTLQHYHPTPQPTFIGGVVNNRPTMHQQQTMIHQPQMTTRAMYQQVCFKTLHSPMQYTQPSVMRQPLSFQQMGQPQQQVPPQQYLNNTQSYPGFPVVQSIQHQPAVQNQARPYTSMTSASLQQGMPQSNHYMTNSSTQSSLHSQHNVSRAQTQIQQTQPFVHPVSQPEPKPKEPRQKKSLQVIDPETGAEVDLLEKHENIVKPPLQITDPNSDSIQLSAESEEFVPSKTDKEHLKLTLPDHPQAVVASDDTVKGGESMAKQVHKLLELGEAIQNETDSLNRTEIVNEIADIIDEDACIAQIPKQFSTDKLNVVTDPNLEDVINVATADYNEPVVDECLSLSSPEIIIEKSTKDLNIYEESSPKRQLRYDRDTLLEIGKSKQSRRKPEEMPDNLPEIIQRPKGGNDFFIPEFMMDKNMKPMRSSMPNKHYSSGRQTIPGPNRRNNGRAPTRVIEAPNREKEELKRSESAYVPSFRASSNALLNNEDDLRRKVLVILNKIAPQNFDTCMAEIEELNIDNKVGLEICIDTLFKKAVKEEAYSGTFATVCTKLSKLKVNLEEGTCITFKSLLLNRCQKMFETPLKVQLDEVANHWDTILEEETDDERKRVISDEKDEQIKKAKDGYYGNIRFIGELFLQNLLSSNVIHRCISQLLKNKEEESLEFLCKLLETTGARLDEPKAESWMNAYFEQIDKLIASSLESRIKYKLMDIKEMRKRKWVLRKIQEQRQIRPMTKDELEVEERRKHNEKMLELEKAAREKQQQPRGKSGSVMDNRSKRVPQKPAMQKPIDASKIFASLSGSADLTKLGPSTTNSWIHGSRVAKDDKKESTSSRASSGRSNASLHNSRETSRSRDASPKSSMSSLPSSFTVANKSADHLSEDARNRIRTSATHILGEYSSVGNIDEEACRHIESHGDVFVEFIINEMLDGTSRDRANVGKLFYEMMKRRFLTPIHLVKGFFNVAEVSSDLILDIPDLWKCFAECFQMLIHKNGMDMSFFAELLQPLHAESKAAIVLADTLILASERIGQESVGQAFRTSGLSWQHFLGEKDPQEDVFIRQHSLQFTTESGGSCNSVAFTDMSSFLKRLDITLSRQNTTDNESDEIRSLLQRTDNSIENSPDFVKEVSWLVLRHSLSNNNKSVCKEAFRNRVDILKFLVNRKEDKELQVLSAVQAHFLEYHSPDVVNELFEELLLATVISEDGFKAWESHPHSKDSKYFKDTQSAANKFLNRLSSKS